MGFNTTVVVLNDALGDIENDVNFGKKLSTAIRLQSVTKRDEDVSAGPSCNAATVIEQHHADISVLVAVGGNCGTYLCSIYEYRHNEIVTQERLLQSLADKLGYTVKKKKEKAI